MVHSTPTIQLWYEKWWYSITIDFGKEWVVITQWKTMDELMKNIDEALECHFGEQWYEVNLNIPVISFSRYRRSHASHVSARK